MLAWMQGIGLAWRIEADPVTFYLLEIGAGPRSEIDPLELIMAYQPGGVVCYFSALAFHSLTSQVPSHHHVAELIDRVGRDPNGGQSGAASGQDGDQVERESKHLEQAGREAVRASPYGRHIFSYGGTAYYLTRRARRLVPGVQTRIRGPRGWLRITTLEQSLLDALCRPQSCGGPAVVVEAWVEATGSGRLDEERLAGYLESMDYPSTSRRVGAMLKLVGHEPGARLQDCLNATKGRMKPEGRHARISLLPGFGYSSLDEEWLVNLP